jgi:hypothetical protein
MPIIFCALGLIVMFTGGHYWWALLCFMLAVSIRYSIILIVSMVALLTLITLSGCSGVPMKNLDYSNGQSISTNPCNFYVGDHCISLR